MENFAFLLALGALIWAFRNWNAIGQFEEKQQSLQDQVQRLLARIDRLSLDLKTLRETRTPAEAPPEPPAASAAPVAPPEPEALPPSPTLVEAQPSVAEAPPVPPPADEPQVAAPQPPTPPPPQSFPPRPPSPPVPPRPVFDWEALIGVKLFSWIAGIALVFAAIFFLKYSVDHGWLNPPIRMAIGLVIGAALLVVCEWKAARRYAVTANALDAAGIAILFSTFFASHALWNLIPAIPTFVLMALVTAVAVLLSIRRDSLFVALLGLVGGFATPALLSTGEDRPIGLFGYLLLLNAGLAWVAYRKRWPYLTVFCAIFTTVYQWGWVMKFLHAGSIPLALSIFLLFPVLSFVAIAVGERKGSEDGNSKLFAQTSAVSVALPLLFAVYMAAVPAFGDRYWLLFGFLFLVDAGLAAIAAKRGPELLHVGAGIATVVTFCIWLQFSYRSAAWPAVLGITAAFVLLFLMTGFRARFTDIGNRGAFAAPLLLLVFPVLAGIEPATASPAALFGVLFVLMAMLAIYAVAKEEGAIHFLAAFFALAAEAVWSAEHLGPDKLLSALAMYAIFGLFYLGVPFAARRWNKRLQPEGSGAIVLFASLGLLFFLAAGPVATAALWGIALLLMILNIGLFLEAGRSPLLLLAGLVLSWIVIAVWWTASVVTLVTFLIPGLFVVGGFSVLILGGNIWAAQRARAEGAAETPVFDQGLYLALIGHAFLLFVVLQPALAVPPWPFLGVLLVLDLAIGVAALYSRLAELHLGALAASQVILVVWQFTVRSAPWPRVAILCALGIAGMGFVWFQLSRKRGISTREPAGVRFAASSVLASLLGMGVVVAAETMPGMPGVALLAGASVILIVAILAIDWLTDFHFLAPAVVVPAAFVVLVWSFEHFKPEIWQQQFFFATAIYAVFLVYPLAMGARARTRLEPYLAAVMASGAFFFFARESLMAGGFANAIGLLPVTQAALMAMLLWRLLRLESPSERAPGRLAMVAGSVLAFITVAIPLQLDKQWITIGFALLAAALAWLWRRIPHQGLLFWCGGLLAAVFVRLVLNPEIFSYHPRASMPIVNWYLYTYVVSAAACFAASWLLRRVPQITKAAASGGAVLLFVLLNIEIADYYSKGSELTFNFNAGLGQDLTYTIGWGIFAFGLLIAGILSQSKAARVSAIALLSVTIAKCFLHDLWRLGGLYRIGSFVGLAICLTMVALLLQKFVLMPQSEAE